MLLQSLTGPGDPFAKILHVFAMIVALVVSLPFHEYAHAFVAQKLGDNTAKYQGRLTLNPFAHLDIIGSLMLLFFGFGYAKPVPINPYNFKNPKVGMALSSLAGPISNVILSVIFIILFKLGIYFQLFTGAFAGVGLVINTLVSVNVTLAVFNILPIPPLDGSRIASLFLPEQTYFNIMKYERYIMLALFALLFLGVLDGPINFLTNALVQFVNFLTGFVDMFFGYGWGGIIR